MLSDHDCNVIKIPARRKNVLQAKNPLLGAENLPFYPDVWKCAECNSPLIEQKKFYSQMS